MEEKKKKRTLLELATSALEDVGVVTKSEFGRIMHDPTATEEQIADALKALELAEGYENLAD